MIIWIAFQIQVSLLAIIFISSPLQATILKQLVDREVPLVPVTAADSRRRGATRPLHVMCARAQLSDAPKPRESLPCITDTFTINASDNDKKHLSFTTWKHWNFSA